MSDGHLTRAERDCTAQLHQRGESQIGIAREIRLHPSTISRKLSRNATSGEYLPAGAQECADGRRKHPLARKRNRPELKAFIRHGFVRRLLLELIEGVCGASVRAGATAGAVGNRSTTESKRTNTVDIWNRFSGDTVLGASGTGGLTTLVDRQSRFTLLATIDTKGAD